MSVTSSRSLVLRFSGDVVAVNTFAAAQNADSPGQIQVITLAAGANTITPPVSTPVAVSIIPPEGNAETITLKGVTGDTGISLHKTDMTSIGLNSPTNTFVLTASAQIVGVRLIWS